MHSPLFWVVVLTFSAILLKSIDVDQQLGDVIRTFAMEARD